MASDFPYLTRVEFDECIEWFAKQYSSALAVERATQVEIRRGQGSQKYLQLCRPLFLARKSSDAEISDDENGDLEDDDPAQLDGDQQLAAVAECGQVEYHAVYSASWRVPVLYVRVCVQDTGGVMNASVVMDVGRVADMLVADRKVRGAMDAVEFGGALGIQDHPELNKPYLYLHPCHTATLLRTVAAPAHGVGVDLRNYLAAWLSLIGPAVV
ncbi:E2-like conjugating enzyme atg10 [Coemansia sp. RSA 2618]|nr:E2-like conjugating enzyme atg10 [Coemansia sp. RSA 2618]